jgi:glycosyltransferase involved in cell wall biosynthesis
MQIAIDAHQIGGRRTGSESYVYNLVRHLALLQPNGDSYFVYLDKRQSPEGLRQAPFFRAKHIPTSISHLRFGLFYPLESWRKSFDIFHSQFTLPPCLRARSILTVYDLAFERFPQFFRPGVRRLMRTLIPWSCRRANHVITISESSKRDLVEIYRLDPERVTVTYPGPAEIYKPMDPQQAWRRLEATYGINAPFLLYVGNLEPRKNLPRLLEAFAQLKRSGKIGHKLLIVGRKAWLYDEFFERLRQYRLQSEVMLTGYVPATDLPAFYSAASAMIYPSLFEGFGFPVIEAMACGAPVITSFGSSLEEVAGGAAVLADPYSVSCLAAAIESVASSPELQQRLRAAGLVRAARFSFRKMAEQTRFVYHRL